MMSAIKWRLLLLSMTIAMLGCGDREAKKVNMSIVHQLAFTGNSEQLVVNSSFSAYDEGRLGHSRLKSFRTSDWAIVADSGELAEAGLTLANSAGGTWILQGSMVHRSGAGNPCAGPSFQELDPVTLARKEIDVLGQGDKNKWFMVCEASCTGNYCVFRVAKTGDGEKSAPFVFDIKSGKKVATLQGFPFGKHESPPPYRYNAEMHPLLEFAPDGKRVASFHPSKPYQLQLYDAESGNKGNSMKFDSPIGAMKYSPNGNILAALCWDGEIHLIEPDLSKKNGSFNVEGFQVTPYCLTFIGNDRIAAFSRPANRIEIFDCKERKSIRRIDLEKGWLNCLAGSPDGRFLAAGFGQPNRFVGLSPGMTRVWDVSTGRIAFEVK